MPEATCNSWQITLRLTSPLQIGAGTLGMVEKTELYIPGRVLWGALTNALVLTHAQASAESKHFDSVGKALGDGGERFGCLFPITDDHSSPWRPRYNNENSGRMWLRVEGGREVSITDDDLRQRLTASHTSTPYAPEREEADPGLHATDFIAPQHLNAEGEATRTKFAGHVLLPEDIMVGDKKIDLGSPNQIIAALSAIQLGGNRRQGWGRIRVESVSPSQVKNPQREIVPEGEWLLAPDRPVNAKQGHVLGRAILATYRAYAKSSTTGSGYGQAFTKKGLCWDVGTVLQTTQPMEALNVQAT